MEKILILETSSTVQNLFSKSLDKKSYNIKFENDAKKVLTTLLDFKAELFLLNCDIENPRSYEIVRLIRSVQDLQNLKIAMYSNCASSFENELSQDAGADVFIILDSDNIASQIDELKKIKTEKASSYNTAILSKINELTSQIENYEKLIKSYLLLVARLCEVPLSAICIMEDDGPHGYYVCANKTDYKDILDFLNVCTNDFEKCQKIGATRKIKPKKLNSDGMLENFYNNDIKLSSYDFKVLKKSEEDSALGTVHIVSQGNILSEKINYFDFCVQNSFNLFDKAVVLKKKIFFEKRIRRAFSRFVPEQIIDSLVMQADNENDKVGVGETRAVAILFSDIRSFTNISEKNRADVLVAFLNRYFSTMVEIIKKHGGTIDKFIGDAIMAEFGTPVSYEDNCRRAVMAAYEMRDALPTVEMGDLVMPEGMTFNIGIGIHYGDVIVGSIGSKDKTDYSVIGDNVNLASRLEGLTKTYGTQILVSESVRTDAGEKSFCFRHLDDVRVKGKKNAVPIYAVDRNENEFSAEYKDAYIKGMELYKQGIWHLAKEYFAKALNTVQGDKAAKLMLERCEEFIINPPENWDGAIAFMTK